MYRFYGSGREQASLEAKEFSPPLVSSPSWTAVDFGPQSLSNDLWHFGFWTSYLFLLLCDTLQLALSDMTRACGRT